MFLGLFKKKVRVLKIKRKKVSKKVVKPKAELRKTKKKKLKVKKVSQISRPAKVIPQEIGKITHYFPHVKAGVILVTKGKISLGDTLLIKGHTTNFKQKINSMQINNIPIKEANPGQEIGLLVKSRVRHNDVVYKV